MITALQPRTNFPISRIIPNPNDSATYYIRAVIRNGATNATIDTVNLTSIGSNIYSRLWQTPADPSGLGLYVNITISVYTDSGYTTKSGDYGDSIDTFLIYSFQSASPGSGGYGGPDIDYKKIEKMVAKLLEAKVEEIKKAMPKIPKPAEIPDFPEFDQSEIIDILVSIQKELSRVGKKPDFEQTNLFPVIEAVQSLSSLIRKEISRINIPVPEKLNLRPVLKAIEEKDASAFATLKKMLAEYQDVIRNLPSIVQDGIKVREAPPVKPLPPPFRPVYMPKKIA